MANVKDPTKFVIVPGDPVSGAPVDDFTVEYGVSDGNNTLPASWTAVRVPSADLAMQADGSIVVPLSDLLATALKPGTYAARAEADSGAQVSDPTGVIFFDVSAPRPNPPKSFDAA